MFLVIVGRYQVDGPYKELPEKVLDLSTVSQRHWRQAKATFSLYLTDYTFHRYCRTHDDWEHALADHPSLAELPVYKWRGDGFNDFGEWVETKPYQISTA